MRLQKRFRLRPWKVIAEYRKGCSNTNPWGKPPWRCGMCTRKALWVLLRSMLP